MRRRKLQPTMEHLDPRATPAVPIPLGPGVVLAPILVPIQAPEPPAPTDPDAPDPGPILDPGSWAPPGPPDPGPILDPGSWNPPVYNPLQPVQD